MTQDVKQELKSGFSEFSTRQLEDFYGILDGTLDEVWMHEQETMTVAEYKEFLFDYIVARRFQAL